MIENNVTHVDFKNRQKLEGPQIEPSSVKFEKSRDFFKRAGNFVVTGLSNSFVTIPKPPSPFAGSEQAATEMLTSLNEFLDHTVTTINKNNKA